MDSGDAPHSLHAKESEIEFIENILKGEMTASPFVEVGCDATQSGDSRMCCGWLAMRAAADVRHYYPDATWLWIFVSDGCGKGLRV